MANILIVEDDVQVAKLFRDMLSRAAHQVVVAGNGVEALKVIDQHLPDLVITDIFMPEKDGLELIREIKSHSTQLKIIAISGGENPGSPLPGNGKENWCIPHLEQAF